MNNIESNILKELAQHRIYNQRELAAYVGKSLGIVNKSLNSLIAKGYVKEDYSLTNLGKEYLDERKPQKAIILAAGFGMRMVPINTETPKALLEVNGETLIERLIKQLQAVDILDITIVVGFMKESLEFLIDEYGVKFIVNEKYSITNNIHSLGLTSNDLKNTYILPCDIWCRNNPFSKVEANSWYMVTDFFDKNSDVRVNKRNELVKSNNLENGNQAIGIAYLTENEANYVEKKISKLCKNIACNNCFWEESLYNGNHMIVPARVGKSEDFVEINTYEQLLELDSNSNQLKTEVIDIICRVLKTTPRHIQNIEVLKKGMTNRSFLFSCKGKRYIMRIPGEGTDELIDRNEETEVYKVVADKNICDDILYINPSNGYKITAFIENSRVCNSENQEDLIACMKCLRSFHNQKLKVQHEFDIFRQIDFYESLWKGQDSVYRDYKLTKAHVFELKEYIEKHIDNKILAHIDAVPDNFLFTQDGEIRLIDWEYAGMQDPHVDIAMFCIYALYDRPQIDNLIDIYFEGKCSRNIRLKIYCYIAACGLLWSNWCEYKRSLGVEFGEYSLRQYRYAKDYYRIFMEEGGFGES